MNDDFESVPSQSAHLPGTVRSTVIASHRNSIDLCRIRIQALALALGLLNW
ncbi:hypothetical protein [Streptomyces sp. NPDC001536]|uniref:hypothetical protein n=1 Tax=Streptomyces sp. NPDC001536 TaxID=3364583 RepID=UPI0036BD98FE